MEYNPIQTTPFSLKLKLKSRIWDFINVSLYRYSPFCFRRFRVMLVNLFGGNIDKRCSLNRKSKISHPWNLTMGYLSSIGENTWIYCLDKISIGDKCCIGNDVYLLTGSHDINKPTFDLITKPIVIKNNSWVATGSYILPGITIGNNCVVAAKSLVNKSVEDNSIVGGNPAKFIKKRIIKD
jgi:putative colanic acid biosynthesis acetyltransferase WcaF